MALHKAHKSDELKPKDLKWTCDADVFDFENTKNVKPIEGIVGQERALKALRIGCPNIGEEISSVNGLSYCYNLVV